MDKYVHWVPSEDTTGTNVYYHICVFYFILDMFPVFQQQDPIIPSTGPPYQWLTQWLIKYAVEMGTWMDTTDSITPYSIQSFRNAPDYHMEDYEEPTGGWKTFNEFFARHLKKGKRPIAPDTEDYLAITSPADCSYNGQWVIDENANITTFTVKGLPWCISQLLRDTGNNYSYRFAGGIFTHSFLSPRDYHRQHAPVSGKVIEAKVIPGICYLEVVMRKDEERGGNHRTLRMHRPVRSIRSNSDTIPIEVGANATLDAPNTSGYQFLQARALILIDNPDLGLVAVLPIGMAQVSSVVLSVKPGEVVQKGQEISYFQFGGSDIVMVFEKNAQVQIKQKTGKHYKYGVQVATAARKIGKA